MSMKTLTIFVRVILYCVVAALFVVVANLVFANLSSEPLLILALIVLSLSAALIFFGRDIFRPKTPSPLYFRLVTIPIWFTAVQIALLAVAALGVLNYLICLLLQCAALLSCVGVMAYLARNLALIARHEAKIVQTKTETGLERLNADEIMHAAKGNPVVTASPELQKKLSQLGTAMRYQAPSTHPQVQPYIQSLHDRYGTLMQSIASCAGEQDIPGISVQLDELLHKIKEKDDLARLYH